MAEATTAPEATKEVGDGDKFNLVRWFIGYAVFYFFYATAVICLTSVLLPVRLDEVVGDANKAIVLGVLGGFASVVSFVASIVTGALGDATRSRFGKRRPWLFLATLLSVAGYLVLGNVGGFVAGLAAAYALVSFSNAAILSPVQAMQAERVPSKYLGTVTTAVSLGNTTGISFGAIFGAWFIADSQLGINLAGLLLIIAAAAWLFIVPREADNRQDALDKSGDSVAKRVLKAFIPPRAARNYWCVFATRTLFMLAINMYRVYRLYTAQDYLGMTAEEAAALLATIAGFEMLINITTAFLGTLSDKIHARKPIIYIGIAMLAIGFVGMVVSPSIPAMFACGLLSTIGMGFYGAVDDALNAEILPSREENVGSHLGYLMIATSGGQAAGSMLGAAVLAGTGNNYAIMYAVAFVMACCSFFALKLVKGVK